MKREDELAFKLLMSSLTSLTKSVKETTTALQTINRRLDSHDRMFGSMVSEIGTLELDITELKRIRK